VKPYFTYILSEQGQADAAAAAGSAPLDAAVAKQATAIVAAIK
jgi:phosphate transport system substrate-binding protein